MGFNKQVAFWVNIYKASNIEKVYGFGCFAATPLRDVFSQVLLQTFRGYAAGRVLV
jgi:hypothetical protein